MPEEIIQMNFTLTNAQILSRLVTLGTAMMNNKMEAVDLVALMELRTRWDPGQIADTLFQIGNMLEAIVDIRRRTDP